MSDSIDTRVRDLVKASSIETREAIFEDLLDEAIAINADADGGLIRSALLAVKDISVRLKAGLPAPAQVHEDLKRVRELLKVTPEDEAELARQQADEENLIDADEFIRQLQAGPPVGSR
jgi:hypothetical protein